MPVVRAPDHVFHDVATGVWCGVTEASDELPARAEILATACVAAGAPIVEAADHGLDSLLRVHDLHWRSTHWPCSKVSNPDPVGRLSPCP